MTAPPDYERPTPEGPKGLWMLLVMLAAHPDPNTSNALSLFVNSAGLVIALFALVAPGSGGQTSAVRVDLADLLIASAAVALAILAGRAQHLAFAASLLVARQILNRGVGPLPLGWTTLAALAIAALTLREVDSGRYALLIGDPNFTAAIALIFLLALIQQRSGVAYRATLASVVLGIIALTGSRMGVLCAALAVGLGMFARQGVSAWWPRWVYGAQFVISIAGPYIAVAALAGGMAFGQPVIVEERILNFEDSSNLDRVVGYLYALESVTSDDLWMYGDDRYVERLPQGIVLPHNWFLGSLVKYGALFTAVVVIYLFRLAKDLDGRGKVLWGTYLLAAGTLNVGILNGLFLLGAAVALAQRNVTGSAPSYEARMAAG